MSCWTASTRRCCPAPMPPRRPRELLAGVEKRAAAARLELAARAAAASAHVERGYPSAAHWLAHTTGTTTAAAKAALATAAALERCPQTRQALAAGHISLAQADEITRTLDATTAAGEGVERQGEGEGALLDRAAGASLSQLRDHCRRRRLQADDPEQAHRRQLSERAAHHRQDDHGMTHLAAFFAPETGVAVANRIDAEVDARLRHAQRHHQAPEPVEALRADAVADLILGRALTSGRRLGRPELVLVCDIAAYQRGYTQPGESCHIIGAGPVPVSVARHLATDAFIKAVLHDGKKIDTVAHHRSRYQPAWLKTALRLGDPPDFTGVACTNCANRYGIDWDHQQPLSNGGPTSIENLHPLCWACHQQKTQQDRAAGLLKLSPANKTTPDHPITPAERPAGTKTSNAKPAPAETTTPAPGGHPDTAAPRAGDEEGAAPPALHVPAGDEENAGPARATMRTPPPDADTLPAPATPIPPPAENTRRTAA